MTRTFSVIAVNRAPVLTDSRTNKAQTAITFTEEGAAVNIGDSFTLTDVVADTNVDSLVIRISGNAMGADSLFFTNTGIMTASYNYGANTGDSITLGTGSIKFDSMVVLLKNLRYKNIGTNPTDTNGTKTTRTFSYKVRDVSTEGLAQKFSNVITRTITIVGARTAATIADERTNQANNAITFTENSDSVVIGDSITITDVDGTQLDSAVIRISTNYFAGDSLIFQGIAGTNGDSILNTGLKSFASGKGDSITLSGKATFANYLGVLDSLVFKHITTDPTDSTNKPTRTVTFKVREVSPDDSVGLWSDMTRTFTVVAVNRAPVLTDTRINKTATALSFTESGTGINIGDSFTLTDVVADVNVDSLIIRIDSYGLATDSLFFTSTGTLTASYNYGANTGDSITLGVGSIKFDSMVVLLDNLRFKNTGTNPTDFNTKTTRVISYKVRDVSTEGLAQKFSNIITRKITIVEARTAPILKDTRTNTTNGAITFTEMGAAVNIGDSLTITDDSNNVDSVVIRISNNALGTDSLFFTNTGTLTSVYNYGANTGDSITLTGTVSRDSMVVLLNNLRYKNTGTNPTGTSGLNTTRTFTVKVRDVDILGGASLFSNVITRTITIVGARTAATIAEERTNQANNAITFTENGDSVVIGDSITITDSDGTQLDSAVIRISTNYFAGDSLIFKGIAGTNGDSILNTGLKSFTSGKGDSITLSGTATFANYIDAFDSIVFKHITTDPTDSTNKPTRTVTFNIREVVPNVDSVGLWSNMTRTFTVVAVNRAPVLTDS